MKTVIIGSGIAGIATAIRLQAKGHKVILLEKNSYTGGKMNSFSMDGFRFDTGPSLFTLPHLVTELFELAGEVPDEHFTYFRKSTLCNYFWDDGKEFSAKADISVFIEDATKAFDASEKALLSYFESSRMKYDQTKSVFLEKSLHKTRTYLSFDTFKSIASIPGLGLNKTLDEWNQNYFNDPKLIQIFNRFATYNGSSPYRTPGIMSLIPHLEMELGAYLPNKGMKDIAESLTNLALRMGVQIKCNQEVLQIKHGVRRVEGVLTSDGLEEADVVVSNMDVFSTFNRLLPDAKKPKRILRQERSSSAVIFYWGMNRIFPELDLHNIFFAGDYKEEFDYLFTHKETQPDPTVYVNITSKDIPTDAPEGCENWFVMVNAPSNTGQNWEQEKLVLKQRILKKISKVLKVNIEEYITAERTWDPVGIEIDTSSHLGSLYGTASNSKFSAFLRHPNFSRQFDNLYFCGGSVHPGGGIPLCLLSAKIVSDLVPTSS